LGASINPSNAAGLERLRHVDRVIEHGGSPGQRGRRDARPDPNAGLEDRGARVADLANSTVQQIASRVSIGCKHGAESGSPVQLQQRRTQTRASA
jgi:hypothetical protein